MYITLQEIIMVITASLKFISYQNHTPKMSDTFFIWTVIHIVYAFSLINLLKPSGYFTYRKVLTFKNSTWCSLCTERFVRISEQTATLALYNINWFIFITVVESVYWAVRTDSLYKADYVSSLKG